MGRVDKSNLISKKFDEARKKLIVSCQLLDEHKIPYHLEGGTLLGIVRDGDLLPWDHDLDISVPYEYMDQVLNLKFDFLKLGSRMSIRKSAADYGPFRKGQIRVLKMKPVVGYYIQWFYPKYETVVLDIFFKQKTETHTYWQAKNKLLRVENKFYESYETINYKGYDLKVPNHYRDYLTQKYGDWSVPVKEWDCAVNELTIVK